MYWLDLAAIHIAGSRLFLDALGERGKVLREVSKEQLRGCGSLQYPHHRDLVYSHFVLSRNGEFQTIKERKLILTAPWGTILD